MFKLDSKNRFIGYIFGITAALFWGFHPVLIRHLTSEGVNAYTVGGLRLYIGIFTLFIIILLTGGLKEEKGNKGAYGPFFWLTGISLGINFLLFHKGLQYTIASNAILLETFAPAVVLMLTITLLPKRIKHLCVTPKTIRQLILVVIAGSIGASLLLINDPQDILLNSEFKLQGDLLEFGAMIFFSFFMLGSHEYRRQSPDANPLLNTMRFLLVAALFLTPFVGWKEISQLTHDQWLQICALGVFSTAVTYALWHEASKYLDVISLAILFSLTSVLNVALESYVFQLQISPKLFLGAFLIIGASILAETINAKCKIANPDELIS